MTWYEEFYAGIDAMDGSVIDRLCTPDTTVRFANHPEAAGQEAVRATLEHVWSTIGGMRHQFVNVIEEGDRSMFEAVVEYTRLDGSTVSIPSATAITRRDGLIASQHVYIDMAPLEAPAPS